MPTFRASTPKSIAGSIAALLSSSRNLSGNEIIAAAKARSEMDHRDALAEKARAEVEAMRAANRARSDPNLQNEYAGNAAGINLPQATQLRGYIRGDVAAAPYPNDEYGQPLPVSTYERPEGITPEQESQFRAGIMGTIANLLATDKTNAQQLQAATTGALMDKVRAAAATLPTAEAQNRAMAPYRATAREPYKQNAAGTSILNEESGQAVTPATDTARTMLGEIAAQALLHGARAKTEGARQEELGTQSKYNIAHAGQAGAAAGASSALARLRGQQLTELQAGRPISGATGGRGGRGPDPVLTEQRLTNLAEKRWNTLTRAERKNYSGFEAYLGKVRGDFNKAAPGGLDLDTEIADARNAIRSGRDAAQVRARFKQRTGVDLSLDDDDE